MHQSVFLLEQHFVREVRTDSADVVHINFRLQNAKCPLTDAYIELRQSHGLQT